MLGGLQGLGHSGAGVQWQRQRWHPGVLHTSGRTQSTALPPWKRLGSANPWQHPPPHGNPPLMATHAPPSAPAQRRARHGGPPHHGTPLCWAMEGCTECSGGDEGTRVAEHSPGASQCALMCRCQHPPGITPGTGTERGLGWVLPQRDTVSVVGWPGDTPRWLRSRGTRGLELSRRAGARSSPGSLLFPCPSVSSTLCLSHRESAAFGIKAEGKASHLPSMSTEGLGRVPGGAGDPLRPPWLIFNRGFL